MTKEGERIRALVAIIATIMCINMSGCSGGSVNDDQTSDYIEEDVIEEDIIVKDKVIYDKPIPNNIIDDNIVYDDYVYECKVNDDIICDAVLIDVVVGETTNEEINEQLPEEYKDYDINWPKVIGEFAVGTAIIVAVGFIDYATEGQAAFFIGTPTTVAKDAFIGAVMGTVINTSINCAINGKPTNQKLKKYIIEGAADGYMWGAISSVTKNVIRKQTLRFTNGSTVKILKNGDVVDKVNKVIGKAFYKGDKIYYTSADGTVKSVFTSSGKEISTTTVAKQLPANSILQGAAESAKNYTDESGIIYRIGDKLKKNVGYIINGYKYSTDKYGRIKTFAADNLRLKDSQKPRLTITDTLETIARGFQKAGDDRGHLFGDMFGGNNSMANLVAMSGKLNRSEYKEMEYLWRKALEAGETVKVSGELVYSGNSCRPDKIVVKYVINNGDEVVRTLIN